MEPIDKQCYKKKLSENQDMSQPWFHLLLYLFSPSLALVKRINTSLHPPFTVPPPHTESFFLFLWQKKKKTDCMGISAERLHLKHQNFTLLLLSMHFFT